MKPENVLLDNNGNVRIADLGLVCILGEGKKTSGKIFKHGIISGMQGCKIGYFFVIFFKPSCSQMFFTGNGNVPER